MWPSILTVAAVMLVLDAAWLTGTAASSRAMIAALQGSPMAIRWAPAALCYVVMIIGLWWFAVRGVGNWQEAAGRGAALGALVYGVYDLTNHATLAKYPLEFALRDWVWGTFLFAVTAAAASATAPTSSSATSPF